MATAAEFVAAVDIFMAARKSVLGADLPLVWASARDEGCVCIKLPLEIKGESHGQTLMVTANPNSSFSPHFHIGIIWDTAICRLDFDWTTHGNKAALASDDLPAIVAGAHYHSWPLNKRFVVNTREHLRLPLASAIPSNLRKFDATLRWFCDDTNIELPPRHTIDLPPKTRLI